MTKKERLTDYESIYQQTRAVLNIKVFMFMPVE